MRKIGLLMLAICLWWTQVLAQGCSDAGVCTIHSFKNNVSDTFKNEEGDNELAIGFVFGKGERFTSVYAPYLEYTRSINERTSITGKLSFVAIAGELANTSGLGDVFLSLNHAFGDKGHWKKSFVVGFKIPFDGSDKSGNGIELPMPYQPSLGTTDLIVGLNIARESFGATVALQQPLQSSNGNQFLPTDYPNVENASRYLPTNRFSRKGDALLRLSYNFDISKRFSLRPSLLSIYHLGNDSYLDGNKIRREIDRSSGITVNGNLFVDYKIDRFSALELSLGTPFVIRPNRPDGLTRSFVASLGYKFSF